MGLHSSPLRAEGYGVTGNNPLSMAEVGSGGLRVLSPNVLEITLINSRAPDPAGQERLSLADYAKLAPSPSEFVVRVNGVVMPVTQVGFKRRVLYAPLKERDLRVANEFYIRLAGTISNNQSVEVLNPGETLWPASVPMTSTVSPYRYNPAIHVNQVGYTPWLPKIAMVGYYLGSLGELPVDATRGFYLIKADTQQAVFQGTLKVRADAGFAPTSYQRVLEADFSSFTTIGRYRLMVPGLGASYPFWIAEGTPAAFAREYALGLYHQRCGTSNSMPHTRHTHGPCHTAQADIPTMAFLPTQEFLKVMTADYADNPQHTAPRLADVASSLYPFVNQGKRDVSGGHHDAGDYSKYTINSAQLVHHLVFAADSLPGVGALDNLGIPESGDGFSDILQEAKWEADYLVKLQDADGGFYFLVYPRDRKYESDVLPDQGDPQVVWPKNTSATAAAVAALAQASSSPLFRQQFPAAATRYLAAARKGWTFLTNAVAKYGWDGSYQQVTHYGNTFMHYDEIAWAATEMYLATGDPFCHSVLTSIYSPSDPASRRWGWWRLFEGYGCAARSYAFAVASGRMTSDRLDAAFLQACLSEVYAAGQDMVVAAAQNAYGTSLPDQTKAFMSVGWFFSGDQTLDLTVANVVQPAQEFAEAVAGNLNYEAGCNPLNVSYLTGLGYRRQREIVHQYAQNDHRTFPPSGLPLGSIQPSFPWLNLYESQLNALTFPPDNDATQPYPVYDRWGDTFNVMTEFVVVNQARSLASAAYWMARSGAKAQPWRPPQPSIQLTVKSQAPMRMLASLVTPGWDPAKATVVWETRDLEPLLGASVLLAPTNVGPQWIELEATWPDGHRVVARTSYVATAVSTYTTNSTTKSPARTPGSSTVALYHLDGTYADATGREAALSPSGWAMMENSNLAWMSAPSGAGLRVQDVDDRVRTTLSAADLYVQAQTRAIELDVMLYVKNFNAYGQATVSLVSLSKGWNSTLELKQDKSSPAPYLRGGGQKLVDATVLARYLTPGDWHRLQVRLDLQGYSVAIDGTLLVSQLPSNELLNWAGTADVTLEAGSFDGWIDELEVRSIR